MGKILRITLVTILKCIKNLIWYRQTIRALNRVCTILLKKEIAREVLYFLFKCSLLILFVLTRSIPHSLSFNCFTAIIPVLWCTGAAHRDNATRVRVYPLRLRPMTRWGKTELLLLAKGLYSSFTTYLLLTRHIYSLFRSESLGTSGTVSAELRSGEESWSESGSKKGK